ncbi:oxysterol-binding protein 1, partial [Mytilus galloprovincialis]
MFEYEHEQRMKLEDMVEQLPKEQVSLEVQAKKSLHLQKNGKEKGTTGSDEDDLFDALDYHADEFEVALPHEIMTHRRMLSETSTYSHIIPDDRSSNGSDTEQDDQEARVYSHINKSNSPTRSEMSDPILTKLCQLNRDDFKVLVATGTFASYENRIYLAGACNIGKSSLASILIGETIPKTWNSTDGLIIHFGRNGIDLQNRKMLPLRK